MAKLGGFALKGLALFLRFVEFCCAAIILGIFSYFLATLHNHDLHIATYIRAVEGISGAGVLYTAAALILVCCLGGIAVLSAFAMLLDLAFTGAFIYVAWATRAGADSCTGIVTTPFGTGNADDGNRVTSSQGGITILPSFRTACRLQTACFAVSIVATVFFFLSIFVEFLLIRHHRKEKAFGPSPNNGYTAGSPRGRRFFWQRGRRNPDMEFAAGKQHPDALPTHATPADMRTSYATESTAVGEQPPLAYNKYATPATGYQTQTTTHGAYTGNNF